MAGVLLWAWDDTNEKWIKVEADTEGRIKVAVEVANLDDLDDVNVPAPSNQQGIEWDETTGKWILTSYMLSKLLTTQGDIITRGATTPKRLALGTEGYSLMAGANEPEWGMVIGATKEFFVPAIGLSANLSAYEHYAISSLDGLNKYANMNFRVPHDFSAITLAEVVVIPKATQAEANYDILSSYATEGEAANTHVESDETTTYNATNLQMLFIDVEPILQNLSPDDIVGVRFNQGEAGHNVAVLGLWFKYS